MSTKLVSSTEIISSQLFGSNKFWEFEEENDALGQRQSSELILDGGLGCGTDKGSDDDSNGWPEVINNSPRDTHWRKQD